MIEQGSMEWKLQRLGKVTASRIADVVAKTRNGYGASRANYMAELAAEILTGTPAEGFTSKPMQWGLDHEPEAKTMYAFMTDREVTEAGFVQHPKLPMSGASPDGYVDADGLIEVKCPNTATHIETLLGAPIDAAYVKQMQWQMFCTGRQWCDWCSFDPRLPPALQLIVRRVPRDPAMIAELEIEVIQFLKELDTKVAALRTLIEKQAA
jgi:putative phage-type endonuclease